jgi:2-iminobutanoate/2-iminopropanoate deaminase
MIKIISTDKAPKVVGPYSQAIVANGFAFLSGQIAIDPQSNQFINGPIEEQTKLTLNNISSVLQSMGSDLSKAVKTTVFLKDMADFEAMNKVYAEFFTEHKPARSTVQVAKLPKDAAIEIEVVALV